MSAKKLWIVFLLTGILFVLMSGNALASESGTCGDGLTYTLDDDGLLTIRGTGAMENYQYESTAPWGESITSVNIIDGVTSIGDLAFWGCSSLTSVTIPDSVTSIGESAFYGCNNLTSITIPDSVTNIGLAAFHRCSSLTSITIPNGVTSIGEGTFCSCSSLASITIPNSVTSIGISAFQSCSSLTGITIPDSVTSIGDSAFEYCDSLVSINIPDGVTSIEWAAFNCCSKLTSIAIPDSVTSIGRAAFQNCSSLISITIPDGVTSIGDYAFNRCSGLTSLTIPDGVTRIGEAAFQYCSSLTSVTIPDGVTSIGIRAFNWCLSLKNITIPDSVTSIGEGAFQGCRSLMSITIPNSVTSIGDYVFNQCSNLKSITVPEGITSIGKCFFQYCSSLESITIPASVTSIENWGFYECSSLTSITIPNGVTSIGNTAFAYCTGLKRITIPNGLTSIGSYAFYECGNLTSITIPESVANIGDYAFANCSLLSTVYFLPTVETGLSIGNGIFSSNPTIYCNKHSAVEEWANENGYTVVLINPPQIECGNGVTWTLSDSGILEIRKTGNGDGKMTSHPWVKYAERIVEAIIGEGVTSICEEAFAGCSNLTELTVPASVNYIGINPVTGCTGLTTIHYNGLAVDWDMLIFKGEGLNELSRDRITLDCIQAAEAGENEQVAFAGIRARGAAQNLEPVQDINGQYYSIDVNETAVFTFKAPVKNGYSVSFRFIEGNVQWSALEPNRITDGYAEGEFSLSVLETGDEGRIYTVKAVYLPENGEGGALISEATVRFRTVSHGYSGITLDAPYHYIKPETPEAGSGLTFAVRLPEGMTDDQIIEENVWVEHSKEKIPLIENGDHTYTLANEQLIVDYYYVIYVDINLIGYDTYRYVQGIKVFATSGADSGIELALKDGETIIPLGSTVQTGKYYYTFTATATDTDISITQMYIGTATAGGMNASSWDERVFFPKPGTYALNAQGVRNGQAVTAGPITFTAVAENGTLETPTVSIDKQRYFKGENLEVTIASKPAGAEFFDLYFRKTNEYDALIMARITAEQGTEQTVSLRTVGLDEGASYQIEVISNGVGYSPSITYSSVFYVDAAPQECGNGVTWTLKNGILEIRKTGDGDGKMTSHPWTEQAEEIVEVIIGRGVTSICEDAFAGCSNMISISIPGSIMELSDAFTGCTSLENVYYNGVVVDLGRLAFEDGRSRNQCLWSARVSFGGTREVTAADAEGYSFTVTCKKTDDGELTRVDEDDVQQYLYTPNENVTFILNAPDIEGYTKTYRLAYDSAYPGDREDYPVSYLIPEQDGTATQNQSIVCYIPQMKQFDYKAYAVYVPDDDTQPTLIATRLIRFIEDSNAGEEPVPAECGNGVTWVLDDGVLTIRKTGDGDGKMMSHPWTERAEEIFKVIIEEGVTSICEDAFAGCAYMYSISIPGSITELPGAFTGCLALSDIYYDGLQEDWVAMTRKMPSEGSSPIRNASNVTYHPVADVETEGIENYSFLVSVLNPDGTPLEIDEDENGNARYLFESNQDVVFTFDATDIPGYTKTYRWIPSTYNMVRVVPGADGKGIWTQRMTAYSEDLVLIPSCQGYAVYVPQDKTKPILIARSSEQLFRGKEMKTLKNIAFFPEYYELGTAGGFNVTFDLPEDISPTDVVDWSVRVEVLEEGVYTTNVLYYLSMGESDIEPVAGTNTIPIPENILWSGENHMLLFALMIKGCSIYSEYKVFIVCDAEHILRLPSGLTKIEENAFEGGAFQAVMIPDSCTMVEAGAFKDCKNLIYVSYKNGTVFEDDVFDGCNKLRDQGKVQRQ